MRFPGRDLSPGQLAASRAELVNEGAAAARNHSSGGGFAAAVARYASLDVAHGGDALCGAPFAGFEGTSVTLVALSYRTPATLRASMLSWRDSGLLGVVDERLLLLNDPSPAEVALGLRFGFDVKLPSDLGAEQPGSPARAPQRPGPRLRAVKREVMTIGAAFAAACARATGRRVMMPLRCVVLCAERASRPSLGPDRSIGDGAQARRLDTRTVSGKRLWRGAGPRPGERRVRARGRGRGGRARGRGRAHAVDPGPGLRDLPALFAAARTSGSVDALGRSES